MSKKMKKSVRKNEVETLEDESEESVKAPSKFAPPPAPPPLLKQLEQGAKAKNLYAKKSLSVKDMEFQKQMLQKQSKRYTKVDQPDDDFFREEEEYGLQREVQESSLSKILNEDVLTNAKANLKSFNDRNEGVTLDRTKLFECFENVDYYPLEKMKDLFTVNKAVLQHVDLTGVDQLNDSFFAVLQFLHHNSLFCQQLSSLTLSGCIHLTDLSAVYIAETFPRLQHISLVGCRQMTEKALMILLVKLPQLQSVNMAGTDVGVVYSPDTETMSMCQVKLNGCPLLNPPASTFSPTEHLRVKSRNELKNTVAWKTYKGLIVNSESTTTSVLESLVNGKLSTVKSAVPLAVHSGYSIEDGSTFNLMECSEELVDILATDRTVFLLPLSTNVSVEKSCDSLFGRFLQIVSKVESAVIIPVADADTKTTSHSDVLQELKIRINLLIEATNKEVSDAQYNLFLKLQPVDFTEQMRLVNAYKLLHALKTNQGLQPVQLQNDKSINELKATIKQSVETIDRLQPVYTGMPQQFLSLVTSLSTSPGLHPLRLVVDELRDKNATQFGRKFTCYKKALELMNAVGHVLLLGDANSQFVVTDLKWFASELKSAVASMSADSKSSLFNSEAALVRVLTHHRLVVRLREVTTGEQRNFWVSLLPAEPSMPWDYYFEDRNLDAVHTLQYHYIVVHTLPMSAMSQIVGALADSSFDCSQPVYPVVAWQSGVIRLCGPITFGVRFLSEEKKGETCRLVLTAQVIKSRNSSDDVKMIKCLWKILEFYRCPLENILRQMGFYFRFQVKLDGNLDTTGKAVHPEIDVGVVGVLTGHDMKTVALTKSSSACTSACEHCFVTDGGLCQVWKAKQDLFPSFITDQLSKSSSPAIQRRGSWVSATTIESETRIPLPAMNSLDFSMFTLTLLRGKENLTLQIKPIGSNTVGTEDLNSLNLSLNIIELIEMHKVKSKAEIEFNVGDTLSVQLVRTTNSENQPSQELNVIVSGDVLHSSVFPAEVCLLPTIMTMGNTVFILDASAMPRKSKIGSMWQVGMRVEAVDRKTPNLICVASVTEVHDDGQILIHFDGWSEHYDYWTEPTTTDIHPVGWHAQRIYNHPDYNVTLQPPRGYGKVFNWETYLVDIVDIPAPYELFTSEQTENCTPFHPKPETIRFLEESGKGSEMPLLCRFYKDHPINIIRGQVRPWASQIQNKQTFISQLLYAPLAVFMPQDLTMQRLTFPSNKIGLSLDEQAWYFICTGRDECLHFVDAEGFPAGRLPNLSQHFQAVCSLTTAAEIALPKNVKHLIKDAEKADNFELEAQLASMFLTYLYNLYLMRSDAESDSDSTNTVEEKIRQLGRQLWEAHENDIHLKSVMTSSDGGSTAMCTAHTCAHCVSEGITEIPLSKFADHGHLICSIDFSQNSITAIPDVFWKTFPSLQYLVLAHNRITSLPPGIGECKHLSFLNISANNISSLPDDFACCMESLKNLSLSGNPLFSLPPCILSSTILEELHADQVGIEELPDAFVENNSLTVLHLAENALRSLPPSFALLTKLIDLDLSGVKWIEAQDTKMIITVDIFNSFFIGNPLLARIPKKDRDALFVLCDEKKVGTIDHEGAQKLSLEIFRMFARFGNLESEARSEKDCELCGCPAEIFSLPSLQRLNLSFHGFHHVSSLVNKLTALESLNLSHNPLLETLPGEISLLPYLKEMPLRGCGSLKTPPKEIVRRGFNAIIGFLRRLQMGSVECKRTKLMLVGLGGAGKTSLVSSLTKGSYVSGTDAGEKITDGIDITNWVICHEDGQEISFGVWDFAGQTVYYNTHQFFMSNRAVYLLLWNIRLGYEHAGLDFWLSSIACHAPKAPVIVVCSHKDQVQKYWLPENEMKKRYPQIQGFYAVSSFTGEGIRELRRDLAETALREKYMGERIPEVWLNFERGMMKQRFNDSLLSWEKVEECALESGIVDKVEVAQAVQFLHDLGSVQHFQNDFLKSRVVINPQWIVNAMSCIVSVQNTSIVDGKLYHKDLGSVWKSYTEDLRVWLLRLTEEFDLTFPSKEEKANIVPCLLPADEPEFIWPSPTVNQKELKMLYHFDYLPTGLFNRVQVRLYQFSESSLIWKKGSYLRKNGHVALLTTLQKSEVLVKVCGPRPENILFMVHEVFEALIAESFNGVHYDFFIPCMDCVKASSYDPCMFSATKIRRATELKAAFLQCDMYFHTISLSELQTLMPPDSGVDFDMHLERSLQDLNSLRSEMTYDIFMIYSHNNIPHIGEDISKIAPRRIYDDLKNNGFRVWFTSDPAAVNLEHVTLTLREAKVVLVCLSNEFIADEMCTKLFYMAKNGMQKMMQVVLVGANQNWMKSTDIGMLISTEVFVNMMDPFVSKYPQKLVDLVSSIKSKIAALQPISVYPNVFISYCWVNSRDAIKKGTREIKGALGVHDPREFKFRLEEKGISCWMDIDRVAQGTLFEEIADGLKHAKVVIVCASDEYVKSHNCLMEFRFAAVQLHLPLIVAVVGTGYGWETSEVGMLSLGCPKISFQHESPDVYDRLLDEVKKHVTDKDLEEERQAASATPGDSNQQAFQELLELAQRKFLRQVILYADSMDSSPFPRLFVLDFLSDDEKKTLNTTDQPTDNQLSNSCNIHEGQPAREQILQIMDGSVEDLASAAAITSRPVSQQAARPPSASRSKPPLHRRPTTNLPTVLDQLMTGLKDGSEFEYCVRILCEHEEGWHVTSQFLPIKLSTAEFEEFLGGVAAYMSRLFAVLKHTTLDLAVLTTPQGEQLRKLIDERCGMDPEFKEQYVYLRKYVIAASENKDIEGIARCRLVNGKTIWLCAEHQKQDGVAVLSNEVADVSTANQEVAVDADYISKEISRAAEQKAEGLASARPRTSSQTTTPRTETIRKDSGKVKHEQVSTQRKKSAKDAAKTDSNSHDNNVAQADDKQRTATTNRGKLIGAEMAARLAGGYAVNGSKACVIM